MTAEWAEVGYDWMIDPNCKADEIAMGYSFRDVAIAWVDIHTSQIVSQSGFDTLIDGHRHIHAKLKEYMRGDYNRYCIVGTHVCKHCIVVFVDLPSLEFPKFTKD